MGLINPCALSMRRKARLMTGCLLTGSFLAAFARAQESSREPLPSLTASSVAAAPNLVPYQPSGWSDRIVVSKGTGTNVDSGSLGSGDTLYVDWAVANNGSAATVARLTTDLYVDGVLRNSWYTDPTLSSNYDAYVEDYSIGSLAAGSHTIRLKADSGNAIAESDETDNEYTRTITVGGGGSSCVANSATLCLNGGRFRVQVGYQASSGSGAGQAVPLTGDTGYFWFFNSNNVELVIKVLDGRAVNNRYWVFYGALTDVAYTITITDTVTGAVKTYSNPQGGLASVADTSAFDPTGGGSPPAGGNHAPTLARVDSTRISHSFGRDDAYRSEGVAARPGFAAMQSLTTSRLVTLDNDGDGKPDATSPIVLAAANLPSCCTLLVAEGASDPDGDALIFHWQGSGGFAFGQKITDVSVYNRNSIFYELPSIGNVILSYSLMGGATNAGVSVTDVRSNPSTSLSSPTRFVPLEWGHGPHLEIAVLDSQTISNSDPDDPGGIQMTIFPNIVGNFLVSTLATFRIEIDHPDGRREVKDFNSASNGARIQVRFKASEIGQQAGLTVVASTPGTSASGNPFIFQPASDSIAVLDLWKSRGCTIGDHGQTKIEVKTGPESIDVWDSGNVADDAFDLYVDGINQGRTPPGGDRLFTNLSLSSGKHNLCVVYVDCSSCSGEGTYSVRLSGGMTFSGGATEESGGLDPSDTKPAPPYALPIFCFDFQVP